MIKTIDIYNYFDTYSIKHSNSGFRYLITAIQLGSDDVENYSKITKLYERVAEVHSTTRTTVERSIRYSISKMNMTAKEFIMKAIFDLLMAKRETESLLSFSNTSHTAHEVRAFSRF